MFHCTTFHHSLACTCASTGSQQRRSAVSECMHTVAASSTHSLTHSLTHSRSVRSKQVSSVATAVAFKIRCSMFGVRSFGVCSFVRCSMFVRSFWCSFGGCCWVVGLLACVLLFVSLIYLGSACPWTNRLFFRWMQSLQPRAQTLCGFGDPSCDIGTDRTVLRCCCCCWWWWWCDLLRGCEGGVESVTT